MEHKLTSSAHVIQNGTFKTIGLIGLLVGSLDAIGAIVVYQAKPAGLFQFIASGAFGAEKAFSGGLTMVIMGVIFHYFIAFFWTAVFFFLYPTSNVLRKNKYLTGLLYGIFVWIVMNQIVLPLSAIPQGPFDLRGALMGVSILIAMIGLPISILTHRYSSRRNTLKKEPY